MSLNLSSLTKKYGEQIAVNALSFEAQPGEIVGFLGPNGAGKSTTMKMLTGFLEPTSGTATVCGYDIRKESHQVRTNIGYLPESNALYLDMYIREFLRMCGRIYKLDQVNHRVEEIIERTGLVKEQNKRIHQLSKGYRQRVGLAHAMLHDPKVLILDEPTSGLDHNQLLEIRGLIKDLGKEKTVLFSSHIMQEIQALCDRVLIINEGKLMADTPISELDGFVKEESRISVQVKSPDHLRKLSDIPELLAVEEMDSGKQVLRFPKGSERASQVFKYCMAHGIVLSELKEMESSVEDVFQKLTQSGQ